MKLKRIISALLVLMLLLSTAGCVRLDQSGSPASSSQSAAGQVSAPTQAELFDAYLLESFQEEAGETLFDSRYLMRHPENFGITDIPLIIGNIDFEKMDNAVQEWQEDYDELTAFPYDELTESQQLIYDIIMHATELSKGVQGMKYYMEMNSPLLGIQGQLPSLLTEFKLYTVQDAYDYVVMLESAPLYFEDMLEFQRRKSEKGLFMSDHMLEGTLLSCKNFLEGIEENPLLTSFDQRISGLEGMTTEDAAKLHDLNAKAISESLVPAYEAFAAGMEKLKGTGKNEGGLCGLPEGKAYYEYRARSITGSDRTVPQMAQLLDDAINQLIDDVVTMSVSDTTLFERYSQTVVKVKDPMEILTVLRERSKVDFPPLKDLNYEVKYVDPSQEEHTSPAFFILPQVDMTGDTSIYINRKDTGDLNYLFTVLAHEGYPGHMYQVNYFNETQPNVIRRLLESGGYSEGWATYVENMSYQMMELKDPNVTALMQNNNMLSTMLSCRIDIGVNYEGWDDAQVKEYLTGYGYEEDETAKSIRAAVIEDPANYLQYGIGYLEILELRHYAEDELGDDFSALEFHRAILDVGSAPFALVRRAVEQYVDEAQAAAPASRKAA